MLPGKFQLSRVALRHAIPIGYLIGSRCDGKWGHIHRFMVSLSFQRKGVASRLLDRFEDVCLAVGIAELTLESSVTRDAANAFYERTGFTRVSGGRLVEYLERKGKTEMKHRYVEPSAQGDVIVYGKRLA
jgi:GNAT superfamily N-acetyltransferase